MINDKWLLFKDPKFWGDLYAALMNEYTSFLVYLHRRTTNDSVKWWHLTSGWIILHVLPKCWPWWTRTFPRLVMQGLNECGERKNWCQFLPSVFFATFKSLSADAAAPFGQRYDILGFSLSGTTRAKSHSCYLLCFLLFLALLQCLRVE